MGRSICALASAGSLPGRIPTVRPSAFLAPAAAAAMTPPRPPQTSTAPARAMSSPTCRAASSVFLSAARPPMTPIRSLRLKSFMLRSFAHLFYMPARRFQTQPGIRTAIDRRLPADDATIEGLAFPRHSSRESWLRDGEYVLSSKGEKGQVMDIRENKENQKSWRTDPERELRSRREEWRGNGVKDLNGSETAGAGDPDDPAG